MRGVRLRPSKLFKRRFGVAALAVAFGPISRGLAADLADPAYRFAAGEVVVYEITIKAEPPGEVRREVSYLVLRPEATDAKGNTRMVCRWAIKTDQTQTARGNFNLGHQGLSGIFTPPLASDKRITIDARGAVVDNEGELNGSQLAGGQGSAWKLVLQPLPPAGKTDWEDKHPITLIGSGRDAYGLMRRPGTWDDHGNVTADYAATRQGQTVTVRRGYDMLSTTLTNGRPSEHLHGDGSYAFDAAAGRVTTLHWSLVNDVAHATGTTAVPISVDARLMPADEAKTLEADLVARAAQDKKDDEREKTENAPFEGGKMARWADDLPPGMQETDVLGKPGKVEYLLASADRVPVIGFEVKTDVWFGKTAVELRPVYRRVKAAAKPNAGGDAKAVNVVAREGYAVGSITVNADKDGVHALCVTFMKVTGDTLDPKQAYTSPWYGKKIGTAQKKLTGNGARVYGLCGRKGIYFDAIGLVTDAPAGGNSNKP